MDLKKIVRHLNLKLISNISQLTDLECEALEKYKPNHILITYGSLAPGRSNHSEVANINGKWADGIVMGIVEPKGWGSDMGYPGFKHISVNEQKEIRVCVLFSEELPANWIRLDEFEGEEYKRVLTTFELSNGEIGMGYVYAINEDKL